MPWQALAFVVAGSIAMVDAGCTIDSASVGGVPTPTCTDQGQSPACSSNVPMQAIGTGPRIDATLTTALNAFVDGDRLIVGDRAMVAIDLRTGNRSVLSSGPSTSTGTATVGNGPLWTRIEALRKGADGAYYVADTGDVVYRVDAMSGDRSIVALPTCDGFVATPSSGFAFDASGTLYTLASLDLTHGTESYSSDVAVLSMAGGTCQLLTESRGGYYRTPDPGTGPDWSSIVGLQFDGALLYGIDATANAVFSIDPQTGVRTVAVSCAPNLVPSIAGSGTVPRFEGTCGPLASAAIAKGTAFWEGEQDGLAIMQADLATGQWTSTSFGTMGAPGSVVYNTAVVPDPARPLVYEVYGDAVLVFDTLTGQSDWISMWVAPPPTATDPCATSTDCQSCTTRTACGWCNGACQTGSGSGPSSGTCGSGTWAWTGEEC